MEGRNVFYANEVAVSAVPVDVAVRFGFASPAAREGGREAAVWVHMSPALAKILARALSDAVARYEAEFGPLPEVGRAVEAGGGPDQGSAPRGSTH